MLGYIACEGTEAVLNVSTSQVTLEGPGVMLTQRQQVRHDM